VKNTLLALAATVLPVPDVHPALALGAVQGAPAPWYEAPKAGFTPSPTHANGNRTRRRKRYPLRGKGFTRSGLPKDPLLRTTALIYRAHGDRQSHPHREGAWAARRSVGTAIGNTRFSKETGLYCPKETAMHLRRRYLWRNPDAEALLPGAHLGGGGETFEQEGGEPDMNDGDLFIHITDYAERVGITTGGARARCLRGAVEARKVDGQWWVNIKDAT